MEQSPNVRASRIDGRTLVTTMMVALLAGAGSWLLNNSGFVPIIIFFAIIGVICGAVMRVVWAVLAIPVAVWIGGELVVFVFNLAHATPGDTDLMYHVGLPGLLLLVLAVAPAFLGAALGVIGGRWLARRS